MVDFTLTIALDLEHIHEFRMAAATWYARRPELGQCPLLLMCDAVQSPGWWGRAVGPFIENDDVRIVTVPPSNHSQRHRMLSSFVTVASRYVETPWTLKIDTDVACTERRDDWLQEEWFDGEPAFIAPPWGYTKPARMYAQLCEWAKGVPELGARPEVEGRYNDLDGKCKHKRIISWVMFTRAEFLKRVAGLCGDVLPVASQDTTCWYVAERLGLHYKRVQMKHLGWCHSSKKMGKIYGELEAVNA